MWLSATFLGGWFIRDVVPGMWLSFTVALLWAFLVLISYLLSNR
jgi:hypothetical protein